MTAAQFLRDLIAAVPYAIHSAGEVSCGAACPSQALSDNGIQFTNMAQHKQAFHHIFDRVCDEHEIEHWLTKACPRGGGDQASLDQRPEPAPAKAGVERMNRTIKEATVKRYHYDSHAQLTAHLRDFINAYNYGRRLKTLRGLTPYEYICKCWTIEPERFSLNPHHQMPRPNN
jgi:hypothetical protein